MTLTLEQLTEKVYTRLSMYAGIDVQRYGENRIELMIQDAFNMIYDKIWWDDYMLTSTYTLDGSTGVVTTDLTAIIKRFSDIRAIWYESEEKQLPKLKSHINPVTVRRRSVFPNGLPAKPFVIYPLDTAGDVTVRYRTKPANFTATDVVPMDDTLLTAGVCYDYMVDDATNKEAEAKFKSMYDARFEALKILEHNMPISASSYSNTNGLEAWS